MEDGTDEEGTEDDPNQTPNDPDQTPNDPSQTPDNPSIYNPTSVATKTNIKPITPIIAMPSAVTFENWKYSSRSGFLATLNTLLHCFKKSFVEAFKFIEITH